MTNLTQEQKDSLTQSAKNLMKGAFQDNDGNELSTENAVFQVLDGERAELQGKEWILNAWLTQADKDEGPTEPNLMISGGPGDDQEEDLDLGDGLDDDELGARV
jgi:hypothetical protein